MSRNGGGGRWGGGGWGGGGDGGFGGGYEDDESEITSSPPPATPTPSPSPQTTPSPTPANPPPTLTSVTSSITTSLLVTTTLPDSGSTSVSTEVMTSVVTSHPLAAPSSHSNSVSSPSLISIISNTDSPSVPTESDVDPSSGTVTVLVTESADPAAESTFVSNQPPSQPNMGAIIGGIVGGVLALILLILLLLCLRRRRRMGSQDSRSATPVPFFSNRTPQSDDSSLPSPIMKRPLTPDTEVRSQDQFDQPTSDEPAPERLYVLVDTNTLMPLGSTAQLQVTSPGESSQSSDHQTFARGWSRMYPESPRDSMHWSPQGPTLPFSITIPQEYGSSDRQQTLALVPISHLGHGNGEPPPEYSDSRS